MRIIREVDRKKKVGKGGKPFFEKFRSNRQSRFSADQILSFSKKILFFSTTIKDISFSNHFPHSPLPKTFSFFASPFFLSSVHIVYQILSCSNYLSPFPSSLLFSFAKKKYKYGTKSTHRSNWVIWSYFSIPSLMKVANKTFVISGCVTSNSGSQYVYL